METNNKEKRIEIKTPFGVLFAEASGDQENYPGIHICLAPIGQDKVEREIVLVEAIPDCESSDCSTLRLALWHDPDVDRPTSIVHLGKIRFDEVDKFQRET